ncbi:MULTISPECIES: energy-coupling factor ABC transporter substrate-binding protein [Methanothrix]|jgi:cobalt/nickel transport protein|uniref:Cobalt transport protein CbiN n=2 Tax=root TaxID=1 RepID=F4BVH3_METSG|nr:MULTISPECIES: energy-coupling factor ABC transporter substrate-binding protein [Methanothrix]AEB68407.1 cobalt transport protein [Methanothrix soehngenii GP6]MBP7068201.1 energy-coupling factor ABC transporter substrate-binding protein [Methanothrix sp.]MDY0412913.1 energy-coupling factor ABC transporter substrate-binding protein [Methanothrix soehngenii]UEC40552.1 MAG: Cobalt transport protein CbiN [Methanothrix sp.]HNQ52840.1 energy-coupling factor ABC transporter substrate-binding protei
MKLEIIVLVVVALFTAIFVYQSTSGEHEWAGADDQSEKVIDELTGGTYEPWSSPLWEPPSGEIESLLFALQAAIGSLVIGYFLGYYRGLMRKKGEQRDGDWEARSDA